jgi:hypothetical protein
MLVFETHLALTMAFPKTVYNSITLIAKTKASLNKSTMQA